MSPHHPSKLSLDSSQLLNYSQVFIQLSSHFHPKSKQFTHLYLHSSVIYWPERVSYELDVVYGDEIQARVNIGADGDTPIGLHKIFPYLDAALIAFKLYKRDLDN